MELSKSAQALRDEFASIQGDKERARQHMSALENKLRDSREKLTSIKHKLETGRSMKDQMHEYREAVKKQNRLISEADKEIEALVPDLAKAQAKVNDITEVGAEKEKRFQKETSRLFDSYNQLKTAYDEIEHYVNSGKASRLARCMQEVDDFQREVKRLQDETNNTISQLHKYQGEIANAKNTEQKIVNNLRYRQNLRNIERLKGEIAELEAQDPEGDRERFQQQAERMNQKNLRLATQRSEIAGAMKAKDNELVHLMRQYDIDFKDAKDNYRKATVKVQTTKAAIEDLTKYSAALDMAVMKYHSMKMEEINRIIDELWKATYRGTDVDTIMIRSEAENTKGNRNYNYRVCMVKQDTELDMRGRCSAGQKVLACIIIRLALAECFGVNCGLIALDEPTTNLDRDNIKSLARSLAQIIETRQKQANFQLIVITHDEDFLSYMSCSDYCDHYYRL
ncbi:P-loop containing nucleoside triphosphate hydrolase protein [Terfezia boudieri ATCC MYA-4762]|uniref:P-loop containing nucleoside triphosphate hydrolase protein n=1 Tax=Terfezia boudieri ATCC MYA-4762 TaxID=1051890 RepID=A0A3N4M4R5_9PEZI|nr:P-loop containing nucleoside triphosphate hydrolase protein [Terfezia boudieri ATCC MYA-4762]